VYSVPSGLCHYGRHALIIIRRRSYSRSVPIPSVQDSAGGRRRRVQRSASGREARPPSVLEFLCPSRSPTLEVDMYSDPRRLLITSCLAFAFLTAVKTQTRAPVIWDDAALADWAAPIAALQVLGPIGCLTQS
jgi:hypothetical protein